MNKLLLFVVLGLVSVVLSQDPFTAEGQVNIGKDQVGYFEFTTPNIEGAVTVTVETPGGIDDLIQFCATPVQGGTKGGPLPVPFGDLATSCNGMSYGSFKNDTDAKMESQLARKSFSAFSSRKRGNVEERAVEADDEDSSNVLVLQSNTKYGMTVAAPDSNILDRVSLSLTGTTCAPGSVGSGAGCITPTVFPATQIGLPTSVGTVEAGKYLYYSLSPPYNAGAVKITISDDDLSLFVGAGFAPTKDNYSPVGEADDDTDELEISNPYGPTWYLAIYNSQDDPVDDANVTVTIDLCAAGTFGVGCDYSIANDVNEIFANQLNVTLKNTTTKDWIYYKLTNQHFYLPEDAEVVRVTVTLDSYDKNKEAPTILARAGNIPTPAVHNFNASGAAINQLILPNITTPAPGSPMGFVSNVWYIAVGGISSGKKLVIWTGNCANNCSNEKHGKCNCNGQECDFFNQFQYPYNTTDSYGKCDCSSKSYTNYDCTDDDDGFQTIYIVLIAVGGAIVLAVAVGVPVYCYLQNRKKNTYERV